MIILSTWRCRTWRGLRHLVLEEGFRQDKSTIPRLLTALPDSVHLESLAWLDSQGYHGLTEALERHCDSLKELRMFSRVPSGLNALSREQLDVLVDS